ncbi:effector-associated constant component EACC1 [Streptomyces chartreusis]|uniref:effector-associated constant component EACC1 n=1 Tax=Streptomyces chartreusis TaxID=1969 RepID=UPI0034249C58
MRIRIQGDGDELALTDLQGWLSLDPQARRLSVVPVSRPGATMSALHALDIVFEHGLDIANFAVAYANWRVAKAGAATHGARNLTYGGTTVDISQLDHAQLADLLRRLESESTDPGMPLS